MSDNYLLLVCSDADVDDSCSSFFPSAFLSELGFFYATPDNNLADTAY